MKGKSKKSPNAGASTPQARLLGFTEEAVTVARVAKKHRISLGGMNHYANKLAALRAEANVEFGRLSGKSVGDTSALAELMERVFSTSLPLKERVHAVREIQFSLKTTWSDAASDQSDSEEGGVFPLVTLNNTKRGYLVSVGKQINGSYAFGWYDCCAVMMRRLLESSIIEAFEAKKIEKKIQDGSGDFFQLTALVKKAVDEPMWNLPRNVRNGLPNLRDLGHRSAHNRYYLATKSDIDKLTGVFRETVETFLHLAALL